MKDPVFKRINALVQAHIDEHDGEKFMPNRVVVGVEEADEIADMVAKQSPTGGKGYKDPVATLHFEGGGKVELVTIPAASFLALGWSQMPPAVSKVFKKKKRRKAN